MAVGAAADSQPILQRARLPVQLIGGWEAGLLGFMVLLYLVGVYVNPNFFGSPVCPTL